MRPLFTRLFAVLAAVLAFSATAPARSANLPATPQQVLVLFRMPPAHVRSGPVAGGSYGDEAGRSARRRSAQRLAEAYGLDLVDGWAMPLIGLDCYIMSVPAGRSPEAVAEKLSHEPEVRLAQANHGFHAQGSAASTADPLLRAQPATAEWRLNALHELATGKGVRVAVIDSMIDQSHPDLAGQVELVRNFAAGHDSHPEDHGTGVAGVIAARAENGVGIMGVAPRARLLGLRACWQATAGAQNPDTVCDSLSLAQALHFAIEAKVQVINLSLAGPPDPLLGTLIDLATARGIRVVAAYDRKAPDGGFPASHAGVIAVADEALASLPKGVYSAPGRDVPTTRPGGKWFVVDGSSYAAAHVSGLLALMSERNSSKLVPASLIAQRAGGEIDACASLLRVASRSDCACAVRPLAASTR
jgi:subtilisin family serine protease